MIDWKQLEPNTGCHKVQGGQIVSNTDGQRRQIFTREVESTKFA